MVIRAKERIKWGRGEGAVRKVEILKWMVDGSLTEDVALQSKPAEGEGENPEDLKEGWAEHRL